MVYTFQSCNISNNSDRFGVTLSLATDGGNMGKEERKRLVLQLLVESGLHLPPAVIFYNCKQQGATFERRSVDNYLSELVEDGYVEKSSQERGYYKATEKGQKHYLDN